MNKRYPFILIVVSFLTMSLCHAEETSLKLDENTVALWNFSEASGKTTRDEGPSEMSLTLMDTKTNPNQWDTGKHGSGLRFPGRLQSKIDPTPIQLDKEITVEAWIKVNAEGAGRRMGIIQNMIYAQSGFRMEVNKAGRLVWEVEKPKKELSVVSDSILMPDEWTHVAGTYDGNSLKIFINGNLDAKKNESGGVVFPDKAVMMIGYTDSDEKANFYGIIDSIRISRVAKTAFEESSK